ncbi:uncharacterized protein I206_106198 [Kwoniella pini CBS 10737]|uniref:Mediator of RNA polymerase II transcription subunit 13 n=1 Tax=Kwoniella pini CBS 10737 TaxID=1296096 RepID=A0A1B9I1A8_9TREE|nr:uncharacterized protein I206_05023 [Kwoniella pini CBS 10737]OCF49332.1 hypothetical protein I206_05023 [Kwoniella pini CBS 10737]
MIDFLGGDPPRPTTTVPDQWIIDLPTTDTHICIYRYRQSSRINQAGPSTSSSSFRDILVDPFERAWRTVNDASNEDYTIKHALDEPCGIISNEDGEKAFWYFSSNNDVESPEFEGLEVFTPSLQPLSITQLVTCSKHGHDTSCLGRKLLETDTPCNISLDLSGGVARHLDLLASALVEKMAWKRGHRLSTQLTLTSSYASLNPALRPISPQKFLLTVRPSSTPSSSSAHTPSPLILAPLGLPALQIGPSFLTGAQESHLISTFDTTFSHTWKDGRSERRAKSHILGGTYSDWSIYWVPIDDKTSSSKGKMTPRQLVKSWQSSQGVLTIWPTHLSQSYFTFTPPKNRDANVKPHLPDIESSDLLGISTGLFDFLSTYKEPDPPVDQEEDEEDINMDAESTVITVEADSDQILHQSTGLNDLPDGIEGGDSDLDDLFSAHSDSPNVTIIPDQDQPIILMGDTDTPIEVSSSDIVNSTSPKIPITNNNTGGPARLSRNGTGNVLENGQKEEMVTEDDFAFFDSPTDEIDAPLEDTNGFEERKQDILDVHQHISTDVHQHISTDVTMEVDSHHQIDQIEILPVQEAKISEQHSSLDSQPVATTENQNIPAATHEDIDGFANRSGIQQDMLLLPVATLPSPPVPPSPNLVPPPFPLPHIVPPASWVTKDLVPPSFSPLPLLPQLDSPFPYSLPTPAPTPSDLNWNLVERLQPPKSSNPSYAKDWKVDEELSELDDADTYTGPPTPMSDYSTDSEEEETNRKNDAQTTSSTPPEGFEYVVEFGGIRCAGADWIHLIYDVQTLQSHAVDWNPSWDENLDKSLVPPHSPPEQVIMKNWHKGLDVSGLIKELVGNFVLRDTCSNRSQRSATMINAERFWQSSSIKEGMSLSDLNSSMKSRSLSQPQLSAGYHHYSINLNISSIQYWTELGLQPHGGYKDVRAKFLCVASDESAGAADWAVQIGKQISRIWKEMNLGHHNLTADRVITVKPSALLESVATTLNQSQANTALYIVLPINRIITSAIKDLFNYSVSPSCSTVIHILPSHSLSLTDCKQVALEVYNKISEPIRETNPRTVSDPYGLQQLESEHESERTTRQAFNLARTEIPTPEFSMSWPLQSYDVLNKNRFIHSTYTINEDIGVMIVFIIDDLGEMFDMNIWTDIDKIKWENRVEKLFRWIKVRADKWIIQWRLTLMRSGRMMENELNAWNQLLENSNSPITLLLVDQQEYNELKENENIPHPKGFSNIPISTLNDPTMSIINLNYLAQLTIFENKIPIDLLSSNEEIKVIYPLSTFLISQSLKGLEGYESKLYNILYNQFPLNYNKKKKEEIEFELGEEIYRLNCLIDLRWKIQGGFQGLLEIIIQGLEFISEPKENE